MPIMTAQPTINGYPIIAEFSTPKAPATRAGRVILVDRGESALHRYVTAWQGREGDLWDKSWLWGHYCASYEEARADFTKRCQRGY